MYEDYSTTGSRSKKIYSPFNMAVGALDVYTLSNFSHTHTYTYTDARVPTYRGAVAISYCWAHFLIIEKFMYQKRSP